MKIDYCFHTHTSRCGHARGLDESYVLNAIAAGIKVMGFSDHVFLPNHKQKGIRGDYSELEDYINSVKTLKEKYKNQITILLGFECEYFEEYKDYYKSLLNKGFDYFILGQHFFMDDGFLVYLRNELGSNPIERYYSYIKEGIESGLFTYFAHPDLFVTVLDKWDDYAIEVSERICKLCLKHDIPLEINLNGMTWALPERITYPYEKFWEIVSKFNNKVVIGYDAHWPEYFVETKYIERALEIAKKYNLNLINKEDILEIMKRQKNQASSQ